MGNEFDAELWTAVIVFSFFLFMAVVQLMLAYVVWRTLRVQRGLLQTLAVANKINAETLEMLKGTSGTPPPGEDNEEPAAVEQAEADADEDETPADFVYCPVCSTRVEVDPTIRNVNVVCPDCKKPFHIH